MKILLRNILVMVAYLVAGLIAELWNVPGTKIPPILWPPSGIALAGVLLWGYRVLPGIAIGTFVLVLLLLQRILHDLFWIDALFYSLGSTLMAAVGVWIIHYFTHSNNPFYKTRDIFIFVLAAFVSALINASIGSLTSLLVLGSELLSKFEINFFSDLLGNWLGWWLAYAVGMIIFTPIIIIWHESKIFLDWKKLAEFIFLIALATFSFVTISTYQYYFGYILIPFCVWATVRLGAQLSITTAFIIAMLGTLLEIHGYGGFEQIHTFENVCFLQAFVVVVFFTTLNLSAVFSQREKIYSELEKTRNELEERVTLRTKDLYNRNRELDSALSNLKRAEVQLVQAAKMSSLGVLTAGIAHEINNPINFITGNINPLKNDLADISKILAKYTEVSPQSPQQLEEVNQLSSAIDLPFTMEEISRLVSGIEEGARRTEVIVKGLSSFSHLDRGGMKFANIHENIDSTLTLLYNQYKNRIEIIKNYGNLPLVKCYPDNLNQVFMNILMNATQAIQDKGQIIITTMQKDNRAIISIRDTGEGISKDTIDKIFEPFFTTKEVGIGTGLGLSISYRIIQDHHGTIQVKSEVGEGSEFIINIPINPPV